MNKVDLTGILTQHTIMAVTLAGLKFNYAYFNQYIGSSTTGKPLPEKDLERALDACDLVMKLDGIKMKVYPT